MNKDKELADRLKEIQKSAQQYEPCMSLFINADGGCVELYLDTSLETYDEWIPGEGSDIGLIRCRKTNKVVGVRLPKLRDNLVVDHLGPIRINEGFLRKLQPDEEHHTAKIDPEDYM